MHSELGSVICFSGASSCFICVPRCSAFRALSDVSLVCPCLWPDFLSVGFHDNDLGVSGGFPRFMVSAATGTPLLWRGVIWLGGCVGGASFMYLRLLGRFSGVSSCASSGASLRTGFAVGHLDVPSFFAGLLPCCCFLWLDFLLYALLGWGAMFFHSTMGFYAP